jgi:hypothetical protein
MVRVDGVPMRMPYLFVPVRMRMRLRSFPPFVLVLVMLVMHVAMLVRDLIMGVLENGGVIGRPNHPRGNRRRGAYPAKHTERRNQAE